VADDGLERLRRWREQDRGVPPAFGRIGARLEAVERRSTSVRLPLRDELRLPDGSPTAAVTCLAADFGLTTSVISSLPDLRGVTTVSMTVDHLGLPPVSGALVSRCTAQPYADGGPQHATGALHDEAGRQVAAMSGWFLAAPAEPTSAERVGLVHEPPAAHLLDLLEVEDAPTFTLRARDALSNALGTLHGGVGAMAGLLAAQAALAVEGAATLRPLTASFAYLRPTPRDGSVTVSGTVVRAGRRTGASSATVTDAQARVVLQAAVIAG
jgi:acyl-coenzyme A thioesterase PaaI-like protein